MSAHERRALQVAVAIGSLVPIGAGAAGVLLGPAMMGRAAGGSADLESHFRYLSGLLLAIGIGYVSTIPNIEKRGDRFRLLTGIVVVGGVGRLLSALAMWPPTPVILGALVMELIVTPGLAFWQRRVARLESRRRATVAT
jgi:Domain of unknown function (DUF4345)